MAVAPPTAAGHYRTTSRAPLTGLRPLRTK